MVWVDGTATVSESGRAGPRPSRVAARALIICDGALLVVNAFRGAEVGLWCAPGGGGEAGEGLTDTLCREVREETGLAITPGPLAGVSEFHNPESGFHQVDIFFHATALMPLPADWSDPEGVVVERRWADAATLAKLPHKPDHLAEMAFSGWPATYHPLHRMVPPPIQGADA
ncbi:MAG: NUDIX domain-containing protein [Pseudomonadota bacterium]